MQSLTISALSLSISPVTDQSAFDSPSLMGKQGVDGSFAALLRRQGKLAATKDAAAAQYELGPETLQGAALLPFFAASGKSLPQSGSLAADIAPAEVEVTLTTGSETDQAVPTAATPMFVDLPIPAVLFALPEAAVSNAPTAAANDGIAPSPTTGMPTELQAQSANSAMDRSAAPAEASFVSLASAAPMLVPASAASKSETQAAIKPPETPQLQANIAPVQSAASAGAGLAAAVPPKGEPAATNGTALSPIQLTIAAAPEVPAQTPIASRLADAAAIRAAGSGASSDQAGKSQSAGIGPAAVPAPDAPANNAVADGSRGETSHDERPTSPLRLPTRLEHADISSSSIPVFRGMGVAEAAPPSPTPLAAVPIQLSATPDRAEAIASIVDRLMSARETGLGALASVAIGHQEFGDITVSFARQGNSLEVSVSADDRDSQHALAAALANADRPAPRDQAAPSSASPSHTGLFAAQNRDGDGQLSRDSANKQSRGDAPGDARGPSGAAADSLDAEPAAQIRGGLYV